MGQMGTADVTYTFQEAGRQGSPSAPMSENEFLLTFGAGTTSNAGYPPGGVPLSSAKLGCPAYIRKFILMDDGSSSGYVAKWDQLANAIRLYQMNATVSTAGGTIAQTLTELGSAASVSLVTLRALAQGW
jgi:hypothetical protein